MSSPSSPDGASGGNVGYLEPDPGLVSVPRYGPLPGRLMSFRTYSGHLRQPVTRRKREMIPADQKDATYWIKREKNNEAARRSRQKRRLKDLMVEGHLLALSKENAHLRAQVLNMQYSRSLCVDTSKVAFAQEDAACAASVLPPGVPLPPVQHRPSLLQAGLWGSNTACLGGLTQDSEMYQLEGKIPCFSPARCVGVFDPVLSRPSLVSTAEDSAVCSRSAEVKMDVQHLVSSGDDTRLSTAAPAQLLSPIPAFLSSPGALRPVSALPCPSHNWVLPLSSYSAASGPDDLTLHRRPPYLSPPAVYPGLPLHLQETRHRGLSVDAHVERETRSRFSGAPARISHVGAHLSPGGR